MSEERKKLIEHLEESKDACDRPDYLCGVHMQAVDEILNILRGAEQKWISVKKELPPYHDHVLVRSIDKWGGVDIEIEALQKGGEQEWLTYYEHWMPLDALPEPPEGE